MIWKELLPLTRLDSSSLRRPLPRDGGGEVGLAELLVRLFEECSQTHLAPAVAGERSPQTRRVKAGEGDAILLL